MTNDRVHILFTILKGWLASLAVTFLGMALIVAGILILNIEAPLLHILNQIVKIVALIVGVRIAVGIGGNRGFITGIVVATIYLVPGYISYVALGGGIFDAAVMLGEIAVGAAIGALTGAILANIRPNQYRHSH